MDIPKELFKEVLEETCRIHKIPNLKPLQRFCIRSLINERDVLACLPTAFGKSLIFQSWPTVCKLLANKFPTKYLSDGIVLVICPLISIMEDQVQLLNSKGISAALCGKQMDDRIAKGEFSIVFGSPELLVGNDYWRDVLQTPLFQQRLLGIAVDEVHTVIEW